MIDLLLQISPVAGAEEEQLSILGRGKQHLMADVGRIVAPPGGRALEDNVGVDAPKAHRAHAGPRRLTAGPTQTFVHHFEGRLFAHQFRMGVIIAGIGRDDLGVQGHRSLDETAHSGGSLGMAHIAFHRTHHRGWRIGVSLTASVG